MEQIVKCLLLKNDTVLITEIVEVGADIGEPDCKLTKPFKLVKATSDSYILEPWIDFSPQIDYMISSESILTLADPTPDLLAKYFEMIA